MWQEKEGYVSSLYQFVKTITLFCLLGQKCNSAKRKTEKLLNSNIQLSHWLEDAFRGCFLKPEHTMKVINDISLLLLKGIILQHQCCYQLLLLIMLLTLPTYLTYLYTAFSRAILPLYPLLLLFPAPFCPSTSLLEHQWASVWSLHSLTKCWVMFIQPEMFSTSTVNWSQPRMYTTSIQYVSGWNTKSGNSLKSIRKSILLGFLKGEGSGETF